MTTINEQYRLVGRSKENLRADNDFYPTPNWVSEILVKYHCFNGEIWECACGDGKLATVLEQNGYKVIATDLNDYNYGKSGIDFLLEAKTAAPNIVTNPPFKLAYEFINHGWELIEQNLALLLPLRYLAGQKRSVFYKQNPPRKIIVIAKKIDFLGNGNPVMEFAWFVWEKNYKGKTELIWA